MVTKVSPDTETTVAIEAQVYDEFIFEGGPPQMNPPSTTCKEYECDSLYNAIIASAPDGYWPMNIQSEIDLLPTSLQLTDHSGSGNHLDSHGGAAPFGQTSTWQADSCSGNQTGVGDLTQCYLQVSDGDVINLPASTVQYSVFFVPSATEGGDVIYFECEWNNLNERVNEIRVILFNNNIRVSIECNNQLSSGFNTNRYDTDFDFSAIAADWQSRIVGVVASNVGDSIQIDFYLDYTIAGSVTLDPASQGATQAGFEGGRPIRKLIGLSSGAASEEHSFYMRKLSDEELLVLSEAVSQNYSSYVDPNPNCVPAVQAQITKTPRRKDDPPTIQIPRRPGRDII
jgi:hypothetical protein